MARLSFPGIPCACFRIANVGDCAKRTAAVLPFMCTGACSVHHELHDCLLLTVDDCGC